MKAISIFYAYALPDELLRKDLEKHLTILKRQGLITTWHSQEVTAGTELKHEIDQHLNDADIILLLVSPDFLASNFCYDVEMKRALARHQAGEAGVIPIILRSVDWEYAPFGGLQALPRSGKPIASWSGRHGRDKAFLEVALGLREVIAVRKTSPVDTTREASLEGTTVSALSTIEILGKEVAWLQILRADRYFSSEHYKEALAIYNQALLLNPNDPLAYSGKGDVLRELNRYEEACEAYEQALRLDPHDAYIYRTKGDILQMLNRYEEACEAYEQALRLDPHDAPTYSSKGDALRMLNRYEEAIEEYDQALFPASLDASHKKRVYRTKGDVLRELNRYEEACEAYEQALRLDPHDAYIYRTKGDILQMLNRYEEACEAYEQALRLDPHDAPTYSSKGDALRMLNRYEEAIEEYDQALFPASLDASHKRRVYRAKGDILSTLKRYKEASRAYRLAGEMDLSYASLDLEKQNKRRSILRFLQLGRAKKSDRRTGE